MAGRPVTPSISNSRLWTVLIVTPFLVLSACAPKDEKVNGRGNSGGNNNSGGGGSGGGSGSGGGVSASAVVDRDFEMGRHLIMQLGEARFYLEQTLNFNLKERAHLPLGEKLEVSDCSSFKKASKVPDAQADSVVEKFVLQFEGDKCQDTAEDKGIKLGVKRGALLFEVDYLSALPRDGQTVAEGEFPFPKRIRANGSDNLSTKLNGKGHKDDIVNIDTTIRMDFELVTENETTLVYKGLLEAKDTFFYNVYSTWRRGEIKTSLNQVEFVVSRASRKVVEIKSIKNMKLRLSGDEYDKINLQGNVSPGGKSLANNRRMDAEILVSATRTLVVPEAVCDVADGQFEIERQVSKSKSVSTQMNIEPKDGKRLAVCNEKLSPLFAADLGSLLF